jgi:hypothetical protein
MRIRLTASEEPMTLMKEATVLALLMQRRPRDVTGVTPHVMSFEMACGAARACVRACARVDARLGPDERKWHARKQRYLES